MDSFTRHATRNTQRLILAFLAAFSLSCGDYVTGPNGEQQRRAIRGIELSDPQLVVDDGDTVRLKAVVFDQQRTPFDPLPAAASIEWSSSDPTIAAVEQDGDVVALRPGQARITATVKGGDVPVSVSALVTVRPVATRIVMAGGDAQGGTVGEALAESLAVRVLDRHGNPVAGVTVRFAVTSGGGTLAPAATTTDAAGHAAAALVLGSAVGAVTVTASVDGLAPVVFTATARPGPAASLTVAPDTVRLGAIGETAQLTVRAGDRFGNAVPAPTVTWRSLDESVATVDAAGLVRAVGNGRTSVVAQAGSVTAVATVIVRQVPRRVAVAPASAAAEVGEQVQFTATAFDAAEHPIADATFTWSSTDPGVAAVDVTSGLATALAPGAAPIVASVQGVSGAATLTVTPAAVRTVAVAPARLDLRVGASATLAVTLRDARGAELTGRAVAWVSSDPAVASVDAAGVVTGNAVGGATITATSEGVSASVPVVVRRRPVVQLVPADGGGQSATVGTELPRPLAVRALDDRGAPVAGVTVAWTTPDGGSLAPAASTTDDAGEARARWTLGPASGMQRAVATVTSPDGEDAGSASFTATAVPAHVPTTLVVSPDTLRFDALGDGATLRATVLDQNGAPMPGEAVAFASLDAEVAEVDAATGVVTARANGTARIVARSGALADTAVVIVRQRPAAVDVRPEAATLNALGATVRLAAEVRDRNGNAIAGEPVVWRSSNPGVATVSADGAVTAVAPGTAQVSASVATSGGGEVSDAATITVRQLPARVEVSPALDTVRVGATAAFTAAAVDSGGSLIPGATFTFGSSSGAATVQSTGAGSATATGRAPGTATITATTGGVSGSATLVVIPTTPTCAGTAAGTTHGGTIAASETWTRAGSPHLVTSRLDVQAPAVLTIEAGALVCVAPDVRLSFFGGRLVARGTAADSITFTASDPARPWEGIQLYGTVSDTSYLTNVLIEYAGVGLEAAVDARQSHLAVVDSARIRQSPRGAVHFFNGSRLSRTTIDTTRAAAIPAVQFDGPATFERTVVRGAAGLGLQLGSQGGGRVLGGRIEGAGGVGIQQVNTSVSLAAGAPVRVVGGATYPVRLPVEVFAQLYGASPADQDSLLGNARDTAVLVGGNLTSRPLVARRVLPWRVEGQVRITTGLAVEPGARLAFAGVSTQLQLDAGARLVARGTPAQPIVFTAAFPGGSWGGIFLTGAAPDTSYLTNALVEYGGGGPPAVYAAGTHVLAADSIVVRQSANRAVMLASAGSRLSRSAVDTTHDPATSAVLISSASTFERSVVRGAAGVGLELGAGGIRVLGGRVEGSGGVGIRQSSATALAAGAPVRVVGGATYPVHLGIEALAQMYGTGVADQDSLLGNGRDTIVVFGGVLQSRPFTARAVLPWRVEPGSLILRTTLTAEPGASLSLGSGVDVTFQNGGRLVARGLVGQPVRFTAIDPARPWGGFSFQGTPADSSYLTNARVEHAGAGGGFAVVALGGHLLAADSTLVRQSAGGGVHLVNASRLSRSVVDTTRGAGAAAVRLAGAGARLEESVVRGAAGDGVEVTVTGIILRRIEVTGSGRVSGAAGDGVQVTAAGGTVTVTESNLADNAGSGVNNASTGGNPAAVDARDNWWGDPAGPLGPNGDGVAGAVVYTPWAAAPFAIRAYPP